MPLGGAGIMQLWLTRWAALRMKHPERKVKKIYNSRPGKKKKKKVRRSYFPFFGGFIFFCAPPSVPAFVCKFAQYKTWVLITLYIYIGIKQSWKSINALGGGLFIGYFYFGGGERGQQGRRRRKSLKHKRSNKIRKAKRRCHILFFWIHVDPDLVLALVGW